MNLFQTPSWMGSMLTSVANERINKARLANEAAIAEANRKSNEEIARANRTSNEDIAKARRETDLAIADIDKAGKIEAAEISAKGKVDSSVIRTVPTIFPFLFSGKSGSDNTNSSNTPKPNGDVKNYLPWPERKQEAARKKADDLFPSLDPTFGSQVVTNNTNLSTPIKQSLIMSSGLAVVGGLAVQLLPFLI